MLRCTKLQGLSDYLGVELVNDIYESPLAGFQASSDKEKKERKKSRNAIVFPAAGRFAEDLVVQ